MKYDCRTVYVSVILLILINFIDVPSLRAILLIVY